MEKGPAGGVLRRSGRLYRTGTLVGLTDAELLELFLARDGEAAEDAFAALVHRHGPTVLGACRRMRPRSHDAEDAFQATFLVLRVGPRRSGVGNDCRAGSTASRSGSPAMPVVAPGGGARGRGG